MVHLLRNKGCKADQTYLCTDLITVSVTFGDFYNVNIFLIFWIMHPPLDNLNNVHITTSRCSMRSKHKVCEKNVDVKWTVPEHLTLVCSYNVNATVSYTPILLVWIKVSLGLGHVLCFLSRSCIYVYCHHGDKVTNTFPLT